MHNHKNYCRHDGRQWVGIKKELEVLDFGFFQISSDVYIFNSQHADKGDEENRKDSESRNETADKEIVNIVPAKL